MLAACVRQSAPTLQPQAADTFTVSIMGTAYQALSGGSPPTEYIGSLKFVVEAAAADVNALGGGTITFQAGTFDLGSDWFEFDDLLNITFAGQGIDVTNLVNNSSAATDTEPFDFERSDYITIRDMTVTAGGPPRSTSDAIDFDGGDFIVIDTVKVTGSRGRGIIFDGKGTAPGETTADDNQILNCIITGVPGDGIELLGSSRNTIDGCHIYDVGGAGINVAKSSSSAGQPNKPSNDNIITNNIIDNTGNDGIRVNSSNGNTISFNTVTNSSDDTSGRDGVRLFSINLIECNDNRVEGNTLNDNQPSPTQKYGLHIRDELCNRTVVLDNSYTGNLVAGIRDNGTDTIYSEDPGATTLTIVALEDAYIHQSNPENNYGSSGELRVDGSPFNDVLVKFLVTGVGPGNVIDARLRLYNLNSSSLGGNVYRASNSSWSENTVTWNNAPAADPGLITSYGTVKPGSYYDVDVTSVVSGDGYLSFRIDSTSANGAYYSSIEGGNAPELAITVTGAGSGNAPPIADPQAATATAGTAATFTLTGSDPEGQCPLTFAIVQGPSNGTLGSLTNAQCTAGSGSAQVDYTADGGFSGPDSFTFQLTDEQSATSQEATVSIDVAADPGSQLVFPAIEDSYVRQSSPDNNYGSTTSVRVDGSPIQHGLWKFDVSALGSSQVLSATLRVYVVNSSADGGDIFHVADDGWSESTVTWNNRPATGTFVGHFDRVSNGTWAETDVTTLLSVNTDGTVSLKLISLIPDGGYYASKENAAAGFEAQLVVNVAN